jgi:GT2 family glycosyltransferase
MDNKFSIVLLQYNLPQMTETCIDNVLKFHSNDCELVLVDNGSSEEISDEYKKKLKYIKIEKNIYFSGGCNVGAKNCSYDTICFLSNDIMLNSGISNIIEFFRRHKSVGVVGTKLLYPDGKIQHAGVEVLMGGDNIGFNHRYSNMPSGYFFANLIREYQSITGAFMVTSRDNFFKVGGFSEEYKLGFEDNDFCFKIAHNLNKKVVYYPFSDITHLWNQTPRTDSDKGFGESNYRLFCEKWKSKMALDCELWNDIDSSFPIKFN